MANKLTLQVDIDYNHSAFHHGNRSEVIIELIHNAVSKWENEMISSNCDNDISGSRKLYDYNGNHVGFCTLTIS